MAGEMSMESRNYTLRELVDLRRAYQDIRRILVTGRGLTYHEAWQAVQDIALETGAVDG